MLIVNNIWDRLLTQLTDWNLVVSAAISTSGSLHHCDGLRKRDRSGFSSIRRDRGVLSKQVTAMNRFDVCHNGEDAD